MIIPSDLIRQNDETVPAEGVKTSSSSDRWLIYEQYAGYILLLIFAVCISIGQITDDDIFWHLATGRWIAEHHAVPSQDIFGYVTAGVPWIPFEWGWDLLTYGLYTLGNGYLFLQLLPAVISCGIVLLLTGTMKKLGIPFPTVVLTTLLVLLASIFGLQDRPYIISLFFFSAIIYLLVSYRYSPGFLTRNLFLLPLLFFVWANMHPGVVGGLFLFVIFVCVEAFEFFRRGTAPGEILPDRPPRTGKDLCLLAATFVISAAALLVNPHGIDTYLYVYRHTQLHLLSQVVEWLPPLTTEFDSRILWFYKLLLVLGAASIFIAVRRRDLLPAILYCGFALYSSRGLRFVSDFAVITAVGTALGLSAIADAAGRAGTVIRSRGSRAIVIVVTAIFIYMALTDSLYQELRYHRHTGFGIDRHYFSSALIGFMKDHAIRGRPFNSNEIGGQLIWELPGERNFIDSRNLSDSIWNEYYSIMSRAPGFETKLEKYGVDYIVISLFDMVRSPALMSASPIPYCEANRAEWRLVYWDDRTLLYLKTVPKFDSCCANCGYVILDPYRFAFAHNQFDSLAVTAPELFRKELKRKMDDEPGGFLTKSFLEYGKRRGIVQ